MIELALFMALQSQVPDEWAARMVRRARPVASCHVGPDCDARWARARRWVIENSQFGVANETADQIVTFGSGYTDVRVSFAVALGPVNGQTRSILFRAWCGNWIACRPSVASVRRLFIQAMTDAGPE